MKLEDYKNIHPGSFVAVCGLGESLNYFNPQGLITIGCNDIGRKFTPTYLLNVNNKKQYKGDRFQYIEGTQAKALFTHRPNEQGECKVPIVKFELGKQGGMEFSDGKFGHYFCTPYMAVLLAAYMGATMIGLIGVDLTDNHFWVKDGRHSLAGLLPKLDEQFGKLSDCLFKFGIDLVNLSPISALTTLRRINVGYVNAAGARGREVPPGL